MRRSDRHSGYKRIDRRYIQRATNPCIETLGAVESEIEDTRAVGNDMFILNKGDDSRDRDSKRL